MYHYLFFKESITHTILDQKIKDENYHYLFSKESITHTILDQKTKDEN